MSNPEQIDIALTLSGTYWKDKPQAHVYVNDILIFDAEVSDPINVKWSGELSEGEQTLTVELHSKDKHQTITEDGKIVKDQLLNIEKVSFDEIDIGYLKHSLSVYEYDNTTEKNCVNLGINGKWKLKFSIPIYIWLLENL